jgi:hypothetical protein
MQNLTLQYQTAAKLKKTTKLPLPQNKKGPLKVGRDGGSAKLTTASCDDIVDPLESTDKKLDDFDELLSGSMFLLRVAFERPNGGTGAIRCDLAEIREV